MVSRDFHCTLASSPRIGHERRDSLTTEQRIYNLITLLSHEWIVGNNSAFNRKANNGNLFLFDSNRSWHSNGYIQMHHCKFFFKGYICKGLWWKQWKGMFNQTLIKPDIWLFVFCAFATTEMAGYFKTCLTVEDIPCFMVPMVLYNGKTQIWFFYS